MQDTLIVDKVLNGDKNAYELLILKYQSQVFATVLNIVKDRDYAQDFVQEAFFKAYEKLDTLKEKAQFYPWLKRIAINLALNHFDRQKRVVDVENEDNSTSYFENIADEGDPEELTLKEELRRYVRKFVDALPDRLRVVIVLREIEDMSYEEISAMLNIPLGTVRSRLFNARQLIKDRLVQQGLADGIYATS